MAELKNWYLIAYDIRNPQRWRKASKLIAGYGDRIQLSIFRCWLSVRDREKLRWELERVLATEDNLILIRLSHQCVEGLLAYNRPGTWPVDENPYRIV
jgi:CRISPR-associated protein Cas2